MTRSFIQKLMISSLGVAAISGLAGCQGGGDSNGQSSVTSAASGTGGSTSDASSTNGSGSGSGAGSASSQVISLTAGALQGSWKQACNTDSYFPAIHTLSFSPTGYVSVQQAYAPDDSCTAPLFTISVSASYTVDASAIIAPVGAEKFDSNLISMTMTPNSNAVADALNNNNFCALTNWENGKAKDITEHECGDILSKVNSVDRNILFAQTKPGLTEFFLGAEGPSGTATDGTTEARRPRILQSTSFVKQ